MHTLYLLRHAEAEPGIPDELRPLTARGHRQVATLGEFLKKHSLFDPQVVWHSTLRRAEETAKNLATHVGFKGDIETIPGLAPSDPVEPMARRLKATTKSVLVVGHNPFLEILATTLLEAHGDLPICHMRKAALLALEKPEPNAGFQLSWFVYPKLLEG